MSDHLPTQGVTFWPVGTGDSTTISVDADTIVQVDIRQLAASEEDDDPRTPIVDRLVGVLPKRDGKPYLAVFVLTHPDEDHSLGFADLLKRVRIGEVWLTPRVFDEYCKDLCDDAIAFKKEAERRVKRMIATKGQAESGDRVRIVGWCETLEQEPYVGFPDSALSVPGTSVTSLDGEDVSDRFRAFIHAPFKDDFDGERNETSLAMHVSLLSGDASGTILLLGDLTYPIVSRIFEASDREHLEWDVLLAPHHCSKSVMYWKDDGEAEEQLKSDMVSHFQNNARDGALVVASSESVPAKNEPGDNPPHAVARRRYEEIAEFACTGDYAPDAIVLTMAEDGFSRTDSPAGEDDSETLVGAVAAARGASSPPKERVGFGASA